MKDHFTRPKAPGQLTDFTYVRFIAPHLCNFEGWCLFIDGNDMMCRGDVGELYRLRDDKYGVMVVKHPEFSGTHSFLGNSHKCYPMLNWSSVMLFNNAKCKKLTTEYVDKADYFDLHQFKWVEESEIGELPVEWNHLIGYYPPNSNAKIAHWTLGAPGEVPDAEHAKEWYDLRERMLALQEVPEKTNGNTNGKTHSSSKSHQVVFTGVCIALIGLIAGALKQKN